MITDFYHAASSTMIVRSGGTRVNHKNEKSRPTLLLIMLSLGIAATGIILFLRVDLSSAQSSAEARHQSSFSHSLPQMDGSHLRATVVEVNYGPGEASKPHSHPCTVIGHVAEGAIRSQVKGEREAIYKAGESFYEAPNGVHQVSANASEKEPAKLIAYFICDHDTPLTVPPIGDHAGHETK